MTGRKPNPLGLRVVRGAERAKGSSSPAPQTTTGPRPTCPKELNPEQRKEWNLICRELTRLGLLDSADRSMIAGLAVAMDNFLRTTDALNTMGCFYWVELPAAVKKCPACGGKAALGKVTCKACRSRGVIRIPGRRERVKAPEVIEQRNAQDAIIRFCAALGLEPTSRVRLKVSRPDGKSTSSRPSLKAYLGG